jgi:hypothetical protein
MNNFSRVVATSKTAHQTESAISSSQQPAAQKNTEVLYRSSKSIIN